MSKEQTIQLIKDVASIYQQCVMEAASLTNEQLDKVVPVGKREIPARTILYNMVAHPREHSIHLQKILQKTGSPASQPSEAQLILSEAAESFGSLSGLIARTSDDDMDKEFEGHSLRKVLDHVIFAYGLYLNGIQQAKKA
ncbi:MAG: hypothetical protein Q7R34_08900 [Dehalococcoidia bacterium]|nr:hypothetical protein [Dehalococcoidia bacterium]